MTVENTQFGTLLKRYRAAAALSQGTLADRAGLSLDAISALESGRRGGPRLETGRRLCDALGLVREDRAQFLAAARPGKPGSSAMTLPGSIPRPGRQTSPSLAFRPPHSVIGMHTLPRQRGDLIGREHLLRGWYGKRLL